MARPRTPTAILEARGAFIPHPERRAERQAEPETIGEVGEPPKSRSFTAKHKRIWFELVELIPPGVAGSCDRMIVELTARLLYKVRYEDPKSSELAQLVQCLSKLGMTPADRSKVSAKPKQPKKDDPYGDFLGAGQKIAQA